MNREYLYWILLSQHQTNGLQSVGAIFKNLTTHQIKEFKIPLPPLTIQQAMVAEIQTEQSLVAANRELIGRFGEEDSGGHSEGVGREVGSRIATMWRVNPENLVWAREAAHR